MSGNLSERSPLDLLCLGWASGSATQPDTINTEEHVSAQQHGRVAARKATACSVMNVWQQQQIFVLIQCFTMQSLVAGVLVVAVVAALRERAKWMDNHCIELKRYTD